MLASTTFTKTPSSTTRNPLSSPCETTPSTPCMNLTTAMRDHVFLNVNNAMRYPYPRHANPCDFMRSSFESRNHLPSSSYSSSSSNSPSSTCDNYATFTMLASYRDQTESKVTRLTWLPIIFSDEF